uniref:MFS domain-containing protein n=1 Tax=Steinernema glaseri TaxID=37863 RepID=A0A1I7YYC4_9BILA
MDALPYCIIILTLVCMGLLNANMTLFNFTIICVEPSERAAVAGNRTHRFSTFEEGWILSMVSIGAITGAYPAIHITNAIGLRLSLTVFCIVSAVSTVLVPIAAMNFYFIMVARFIQGFAVAGSHLACGAVPVSWGGAKSRGLFVSILCISYQVLGACDKIGLSTSVGSLHGDVELWLLLHLSLWVAGSVLPLRMHNTGVCLSVRHNLLELSTYQQASILEEDSQSTEKQAVPYSRMFKSRSIWGIITSGLACSIAYDTFLLYGPIYLHTVLKLEVHETGLLASLPYLLSMVTKVLAGVFLDKARCVGQHILSLWFTAFFQLGMASAFIALTFISADMPFVAGTVFTMSMVINGIYHVGQMNASQIIAQQYTHILSSVLAAQNSLGGFLLPPVIAFFVPHYTKSEDLPNRADLSEFPVHNIDIHTTKISSLCEAGVTVSQLISILRSLLQQPNRLMERATVHVDDIEEWTTDEAREFFSLFPVRFEQFYPSIGKVGMHKDLVAEFNAIEHKELELFYLKLLGRDEWSLITASRFECVKLSFFRKILEILEKQKDVPFLDQLINIHVDATVAEMKKALCLEEDFGASRE